ncbi:MAG: NAD-dependent DNA ligase LigA [Lachnospiraceae bacterium]
MNNLERMKELIPILTMANKAYYAQDEEMMSNKAYDDLYDELTKLEEETGIILANSPTKQVGYEVVDELPKMQHEKPMLSLAKTKEREELRAFLGEKEALISWKLDGLTIVLTYEDGVLIQAVTRGNGEVGEVITANARVFCNIPLSIPYKGSLVLRGEAVISYEDFEQINREIDEEDMKYKNPRNLCSGSVRQLNSEVTAKRMVSFYAFSLVQATGLEFGLRQEQMSFLLEQGFAVVPYYVVEYNTILDRVEQFAHEIEHYNLPSDGLVVCYDDIAYGEGLGTTSKFPRDSMAFKWADELKETTLLEIEWSASRTGLINPVAVFEPVELEGTTVSRASVHNISIVKALQLGLGDRITVYKANMIIPQIGENITKSDTLSIPSNCPVCGGLTEIKKVKDGQFLYCTNDACSAKKIKAFTLFVGRDALNMDGLSEATLEKFIANGYIHDFVDLFHLAQYETQIVTLEGFGQKSYDNLISSIEQARTTTLPKVIYALGIAGIGLATAKLICKHFVYDVESMMQASVLELLEVDGVGAVLAETFATYMHDCSNRERLEQLLKELHIEVEQLSEGVQSLEKETVVITGSLELFDNRNALKDAIELRGGKVTGSVTNKTTILVNNDTTSNSSKNKKAKELEVPIMTEKEFVQKFMEELLDAN